MRRLGEYDKGLITGILIGEAAFGGDGRQPQVIVKMHVRSERLMRYLEEMIPGSKLYGPYHHANRHFMQWVVRGEALATHVIPLLDEADLERLDGHVAARYAKMKADYADYLRRVRGRSDLPAN